MRILVDLNLVLDVLLDRRPHAEAAAGLWAAIESGKAEGMLAAHSVTTLHSLAGRSGGRRFADECVSGVLTVFGVAPVDGAVLRHAIRMGWPDFEDAVCAAAGEAAACHALATRDASGFKRSALPMMSPLEALAALSASAS
ncbi:PIN domain-containing protein [Myxococcota bacterium]|nr:PIN domain-containing protein [Myxococcota bacterium]